MLKRLFLSLGLVMLLITSVEAGSVDMKDGLWEITTTAEMAGMPFQIPPMTFTQCITQQDLVPQEAQSSNECSMTDNRINGNTVTWSVVCKGEGGGHPW